MINKQHRILLCHDNILNSKYFTLLKCQDLNAVNYFYNIVENFFIDSVLKNYELLSECDSKPDLKDFPFYDYYLNDENYEIFKIINYDNIIETFNNIKWFYEIYQDFEYTLNDFYIILDYIQERSIYLNLKQIKKYRRI
jgi:hypothetical protein